MCLEGTKRPHHSIWPNRGFKPGPNELWHRSSQDGGQTVARVWLGVYRDFTTKKSGTNIMRRTIFVLPFVVMLTGCQNFMAPKVVGVPRDCTPTSRCFLLDLSDEYKNYNSGAETANAWTNGAILAGTGGAVIGAAVDAHSDLYKAAGGIVLTAMGFSKYGNYPNQSLVTRVALRKLLCAQAPLDFLLRKSGELRDIPDAEAKFTAKQNRMLSLDTSGATVALLSTSGGGPAIPTTIATSNYVELGRFVSSYDAANSNIDKAERIKSLINSVAMSSLAKLQDSVRQQIEANSFKIDEALAVMKPAQPVNPSKDGSKAYADSNILVDNKVAGEIIDNYNQFGRCLGDDFNPITFD